MTDLTPRPLHLTHLDGPDTARVELHGDLDHYCAATLQEAVERVLADHADLRDLHLHCEGLTAIDSAGLAVLLMIRRRTDAAGVRLHLEQRPVRLDRLLALTGTLDHLTTLLAVPQPASSPPQGRTAAEDTPGGRSTAADST